MFVGRICLIMTSHKVYYALSAVTAVAISVSMALYKIELPKLWFDEKPFTMTVDYHVLNYSSLTEL